MPNCKFDLTGQLEYHYIISFTMSKKAMWILTLILFISNLSQTQSISKQEALFLLFQKISWRDCLMMSGLISCLDVIVKANRNNHWIKDSCFTPDESRLKQTEPVLISDAHSQQMCASVWCNPCDCDYNFGKFAFEASSQCYNVADHSLFISFSSHFYLLSP